MFMLFLMDPDKPKRIDPKSKSLDFKYLLLNHPILRIEDWTCFPELPKTEVSPPAPLFRFPSWDSGKVISAFLCEIWLIMFRIDYALRWTWTDIDTWTCVTDKIVLATYLKIHVNAFLVEIGHCWNEFDQGMPRRELTMMPMATMRRSRW